MAAKPKQLPIDRAERLRALSHRMFQDHRLIIASNRGPIEYEIDDAGELSARRGSGGVVTALSSVARYVPLTWISATMGEGDYAAHARAKGESFLAPIPEQEIYLRLVAPPRAVYQRHYNVFCNPLLWFVQHYMWNTPRMPNISRAVYEAWEDGYEPVNQLFADAIIDEARKHKDDRPYVMLHDYHLYLAPGYVRERLPGATIQHFTHIPWPDPRYWQLIPAFMRRAIHANLCAANVLGFQTARDVRNFLHCCEAFLEAEVDYRRNEVIYLGGRTRVEAYPISVDVAELEALAASEEVAEYERKLRPYFTEKTIVRVDRTEPSKNILRGFRAFELLLQRYPDLQGKLRMLAFLVPSRDELSIYQTYADEIFETVGAINDELGTADWLPIQTFYENNYPQAIAAMRDYDVLLVNPIIDGMNLVAKECVVVNRRNGVLVLSEAAGSFAQLGANSVPVAPADVEGTVRALYAALTMPPRERARRAKALRESVRQEDILLWLERQLTDLANLPTGAARARA